MPNFAQKARDGRIEALKATMARRNVLLGADETRSRSNRPTPILFQSIRGTDEQNLFSFG